MSVVINTAPTIAAATVALNNTSSSVPPEIGILQFLVFTPLIWACIWMLGVMCDRWWWRWFWHAGVGSLSLILAIPFLLALDVLGVPRAMWLAERIVKALEILHNALFT
ncbi:hypothetical protein [Vibrio phage PH669]|uniref:Uncharacterized protein n=1 Tax=Vibrio phage PH669 TaxID=2800823 RepID=A0A7T7CL67_9CAUD|nr:hypothetical protein [Vibrio phage PH669]